MYDLLECIFYVKVRGLQANCMLLCVSFCITAKFCVDIEYEERERGRERERERETARGDTETVED